jgi:hypothetical protein
MINTLKNRFEQGYRTTGYPKEKIELLNGIGGYRKSTRMPRLKSLKNVQPPAPRMPSIPKRKSLIWDDVSFVADASDYQKGNLSLSPGILKRQRPCGTIFLPMAAFRL